MGCIIKYFGSHPLLLLDPKTSKKILKRTLLKEAQDITTHLKPLTSHFEVSMISHNILFSLGSLGFEQTRNFGELTFSSSTKLQTHSFCFRNNSKTRSDILQGQALFRGVKQLSRCLVVLNRVATNNSNYSVFE